MQLSIADLQGIYKRYRELKRKSIDEGHSQQSGCSLIDVAEPMKEIMPPRPVSDDDDEGLLSPNAAGDATGNVAVDAAGNVAGDATGNRAGDAAPLNAADGDAARRAPLSTPERAQRETTSAAVLRGRANAAAAQAQLPPPRGRDLRVMQKAELSQKLAESKVS